MATFTGIASFALLHTMLAAEPVGSNTEPWSQWRGSDRTSTLQQPPWPANLSDDFLNEQWTVKLNEGYSSPILTEHIVFSVETHDKKEEIFRAFDRHTGEELWSYAVDGTVKVPFFASKNGSWARATPVTDGEHVYFLTMSDILTCLEVDTGKLAWQVDLKQREDTKAPTFGGVSSPMIDGDFLYIQGGHAAAKLDKQSSKNVWRVLEDKRGMFGGSFSSPIIATLHGIRQFVVQTRSTLAGVDLQTGGILWSTPVEASRGMNILTPVIANNRVFTASYGGGSFCYEIGYEGGKFEVKMAWQNKKLEGYMTTPVTVENFIYHQARDKKLYCLDFETGEVQWVSDQAFGQYWSMVVNGGQILALDQKGTLILFKANATSFEIQDQRKISKDPTWAHLAVSGEQLFVRGLKHMSAYKWEVDG
ncbi:MAG: PQQ-like beta-propeller repeat protein [Opitutales bacterium]|nr:PQQ-like beta-propeller repeat protein [Opitutales bacterium]